MKLSGTPSPNLRPRSIGNTVVSFLLASAAIAPAVTIFSDNFDGGAGNLNGTTPDISSGGVPWVAGAMFDANGNVNSTDAGPGSATLAFSPTDGLVYTLDARILNVTGDGNWIALGFANGQSPSTSTNSRFITGNVMGTAWMFVRGDASVNASRAWLGTGTGGNGGTTNGADFSGPLANVLGGDFDLRIVLDTTGGAGNWTSTWLAKRPTDGSYTTVRPEESMLSESFDSVGFAVSNPGVTGTIESFSLTTPDPIPEPSSALLIGLGSLLLMRRRRTNAS